MMASLAQPTLAGLNPRDARLTTILLIGRIFVDGRDYLCRIRNVSVGGMRIETFAPIEIGKTIDIELRNGIKLAAEIRWIKGVDAGVSLGTPVDIARMLAPQIRSCRAAGGRVARAPRLAAQCPLALRYNGQIQSAVMTDISQAGVGACSSGSFTEGDHAVLFIPGMGSRRALVRWADGQSAGFSFEDKLGFGDLAAWLAGPDRFAVTSPTTVSPPRQNS